MKRTIVLCTFVVFTTLMLLSACSHERVVEREMVKEPPAASVVVLQSQRPATWVPGYWVQSGNTWVWRSGHWE